MSSLNVSKSHLIVAALFTCLFLNGNRAGATVVDALAGLSWTSATGLNGFGNQNTTSEPLTFTDESTHPTSSSNAGTFEYILNGPGATVTYDLGSPTYADKFAIWEGFTNIRGTIKTMNIDFSNSPTFSSGVTTDVINLPNPGQSSSTTGAYFETVGIPAIVARYVRFDFLPGASNYYLRSEDGNNFVTVSNLQLLPEPTSLGVLGIGGLLLLHRRRAIA